jgi:hypothetical protein
VKIPRDHASGDDTRVRQPATEDSDVVTSAEEAMRAALHPSIFSHTMRVLHLARYLMPGRPVLDPEALAVAVLFHDSGTADENNGEQRFEVEGADAAVRFLDLRGWPSERITPVWDAIALHTSPGIAERFGPLAELVRTAVLVDLGRIRLPIASNPELDAMLARHPRLDIDRVLPEVVVAQALEGREAVKAPPFSWPGALLTEHLARPAADSEDHGDRSPAEPSPQPLTKERP